MTLPTGARSLDSLGIKPTSDMTAWALEILHDLTRYPLGAVVGPRHFGALLVVAQVEAHTNGTAQNPAPHPHRGVGLYRVPDMTPVPDTEPTGGPAVGTQHALGVDLSAYQRGADLARIANAGFAFAFIKATEGTTLVDQAAREHWARAGAAGMLRGAYHFFRPARDPLEQAHHFADTLAGLEAAGARAELPCVIDVEVSDGVDPTTIANAVAAWIDELGSVLARRRVLIYTMPAYWAALPRCGVELLGELWVAHWDVQAPHVPGAWHNWAVWQYTATGTVPGYPGHADLNRFRGTIDEMRAWASG